MDWRMAVDRTRWARRPQDSVNKTAPRAYSVGLKQPSPRLVAEVQEEAP